MAEYTMKDLEAKTGKTSVSIRKVFDKNDELRALLPKHKRKKGQRNVVYDDAILDALLVYYGEKEPPENKNAVDDRVVGQSQETVNPENTETIPPVEVEASAAADKELEALRRQVEDLQQQLETERKGREAERADLEKQLQDKEAERRHFIGENAKLLNLLAAEQEEKSKLLLLMPPAAEHKTLKQRIKGLFTRKEGGKNE